MTQLSFETTGPVLPDAAAGRPARFGPAAAPRALRAAWQGDAAALFCVSQVTHAFGLIAKAHTGETPPRIWFPDYFCDGATALLRGQGVPLEFYPVGEDLAPDWAACGDLARRAPPDIFVLVHYFGVAGDGAAARAFCDRAGACLVEDATQIMLPAGSIGRHGDFVCYGPRKFFDVPDGALLAVRRAGDARRIAALLRDDPRRPPLALRWRLRRLERSLRHRLRGGPRPSSRPRRPLSIADVQPEPAPLGAAVMHWLSRMTLARAVRSGEAARIARARAGFEARVAALVADMPGVVPVALPPDAVACWPALECADPDVAQRAIDRLRAAGLPAAPWPNRLPPEAAPDGRARALRSLRLIVPPV